MRPTPLLVLSASMSLPFAEYGPTTVVKRKRSPTIRATVADTLGKSHGARKGKRAARRNKGA